MPPRSMTVEITEALGFLDHIYLVIFDERFFVWFLSMVLILF